MTLVYRIQTKYIQYNKIQYNVDVADSQTWERGQGDRESLLSGHDDCVKKTKKKTTYNIGMNIKICI